MMTNPSIVESDIQEPAVVPAKDSRDVHPTGKRRYTTEKIMLALTLIFALGVAAHSIVPEPFKALAISGVMILCLLAMYKMN